MTAKAWRWQGVALPHGAAVEGTVEAQDAESARRAAVGAGHRVLLVRPAGAWKRMRMMQLGSQRLPPEQLADLLMALAAGMRSGLSQDRQLDLILHRLPSRSPQRPVVAELLSSVREGYSLSEGFRRCEDRLGAESVAVMEAAENLAEPWVPLQSLASALEQSKALRDGLLEAVRSPLTQLVLVGAVVTMVSVLVIPKFETVFAQMGTDLPLLTRLMMAMSDLVVGSWRNALLLFGAVASIALLVRSSEVNALRASRLALRMPIMGTLLRVSASYRLASLMAVLLSAAVPPRRTVDLVAAAVPNRYASTQLGKSAAAVAAGRSLADALRDHYHGIDPQIEALAAQSERDAEDPGEPWRRYASGTHEEAKRLSSSVAAKAKSRSMVLVGALVGCVAMAVYSPMFSMMTDLGDIGRARGGG